MGPVRALIADDEPPARGRIRRLLAERREVEVVAECADGRSAVETIRSLSPDLVFLDVQMPLLDGLDVVEAIGAAAMPAVIFVTAYDEHAVRAFELHALDYLLKPFDDERFEDALSRALERIRRERLDEVCDRLRALLDGAPSRSRPPERLVIRSSGRTTLVDVAEIDWIEAAGSYARLHIGGRTLLLRESLSSLEQRLDAGQFARIHRSTILRRDRIRELRPRPHGEAKVMLVDGTELRLSRTYRDRLADLL